MAHVDLLFTSCCSRSLRTTAYAFFSFPTLLSKKMMALFAVFPPSIISDGGASVTEHIFDTMVQDSFLEPWQK
jgi:hypothetical protein